MNVLLLALSVLATGSLQPVGVIPNPEGFLPAQHARAPIADRTLKTEGPVRTEPIWKGLQQLTRAERANAVVHFAPMVALPDEVESELRTIERLWNRGEFDPALERLKAVDGSIPAGRVMVGINWRTPIPSQATPGLRPDVQIGARDSAYLTFFDRSDVTGNLFVGSTNYDGAATMFYLNRSTDNGATWSEVSSGVWGLSAAVTALAGTCNGDFLYMAFVHRLYSNMALADRYLTTTGEHVPFRSGAQYDTALLAGNSNDSLTEIAMCSQDDRKPGFQMYTFACTSHESLLVSYSDTVGPWRRGPGTGVDYCSGAIACTYNPADTGFSRNWLWASFTFGQDDTTWVPAFAYYNVDSSKFFNSVLNLPARRSPMATAISAWHDTIAMVYTHNSMRAFWIRELVNYGDPYTWHFWDVVDTTADREFPDITARHGDGLGCVYREYGSSSDRYVMFTHAPYFGWPWSLPETTSEFQPAWQPRPRIEWVEPGGYGIVYARWQSPADYSLWFSRYQLEAVAEPGTPAPEPLGLKARTGPGRVYLSFSNPVPGNVRLSVFDATGRLVGRELLRMNQGSQTLSFTWSTAGIYIARLETSRGAALAKFFIVR